MKTYITRRNNNATDFYEDAFNSFFRPFYVGEDAALMKTDIRENDDVYELEVEMPGFEKKDIALKYENGYLTVTAKKSEANENEKKYIRRERSCSCSRSYYLGDVNEKEIKAKYDNGVLTVAVPKEKPQQLTHSIEIE